MAQKLRQSDSFRRKPRDQIILPKAGEDNILITSALPYCNNVPHLGNIIGSTLSADVFSRYNRTQNRQTLYICGTDEYGTATETQALKEGITPKELCDKYHILHRATYDWFEISFDHFGRTSTPLHTEICQEMYTNLNTNGFLSKQTNEQTFCTGCNKFLADRFVEGTCPHCGADDARGDQCDVCSRTLDAIDLINPRCLVNKEHSITTKSSAHMYVCLDLIQPRTEEWIKHSWKKGAWSPNAVINADGVIIDARLKAGLRPSPVTRDLQWGVPVPDVHDKENQEMIGKVLYVWFDAPIGYPSITANYTSEWKQWWFNPDHVKLYQFMGKDNVYFHTVFFPSILLGDNRNWTTLHHLSTTEYLNYEGGKFSKSHNRGVFGPAAKETGIPPSVWRFYLLSSRPETQDAMFSWTDCVAANNNILLKNFGNFINRTLKFVSKNYDGIIPEGETYVGELPANDNHDADFISDVNSLIRDYVNAMESVKLRQGLQTIMQISSRGNLYLQSAGLSSQFKATDPARCAQVLCRAVNLIYILSVLVEPFMPSTASSILAQLNTPPRKVPERFSIDILPGHHLGTPNHLFSPIDEKLAEVWRERFGGTKESSKGPAEKSSRATLKKKAAVTISPELLSKSRVGVELLAQEQAQGDLVRALKAQLPRTTELDEETQAAISRLKKIKSAIVELVEQK